MYPLLIFGAAALLMMSFEEDVHAQKKGATPNVIIILADDLGYADISCYGGASISTPHIDQLAANGLRLTNGYTAASTCTPSRYAILTGQYAWRKKGTDILPGSASLIIPTDRTTLGTLFQKAGYQTAAIGKWHLGLGPKAGPDWNGLIKPGANEVGFGYAFLIPATPDRVPCVYVENHRVLNLDPGDPITVDYQHPVGNLPTGEDHPEMLKMKTSPGQGHLGTIINGISRIGYMSGGRSAWWTDSLIADVITGKAVDFIRKNKEHPFFLYFASHDIHVPRVPDHRFAGKSGMGPRGDEILELDWEVGQIVQTLKELNLLENTLIVFTSDNGPVLDDGYQDGAVEGAAHPVLVEKGADMNRQFSTGAPHRPAGDFSGGKYSILEGGTRVPFIISWPGMVRPGVSQALVSQVDLLASFAAMLHQDLGNDDAPDSFNMLDAILGRTTKGRKSLVEQGSSLALVKDNWKYIEPHKGPALFRLVNIRSGLDTIPQLYDLGTDLAEKHNLAAQHPERVKQMSAELEAIKKNGHSR